MNQQFVEGMTVYDAAGEKVGTLGAPDAGAGYLVVRKGWLFPKDVYVPVSAIQRSDAAGITLSITKDELQTDAQYEQPAAGGRLGASGTPPSGTTAGDAGTTPTRGYGATGQTTRWSEEVRVPLQAEELVAGTRQDEVGQVHVHKDVVEEQQSVEVPVQREAVTVERVPVSEQVDAGAVRDAFTERDIDVPVMGEEAVVGKQARVTEEVRLHKDTVTEQQQVSDTVRKERIRVEGADQVRGADEQTR